MGRHAAFVGRESQRRLAARDAADGAVVARVRGLGGTRRREREEDLGALDALGPRAAGLLGPPKLGFYQDLVIPSPKPTDNSVRELLGLERAWSGPGVGLLH